MARRYAKVAEMAARVALTALATTAPLGCAGTKQDASQTGAAGSFVLGGRDGGSIITGSGGTSGSGGGSPTDGPGRVIGADALGDAACAAATQQAQQVPLDLYIMLDSSGSMEALTSANETKWDAVRTALTAFIQDPQSVGMGVGLQYFPLVRAGVPGGCETNNQCNGSGPCDIIRVCSGGTALVECATN